MPVALLRTLKASPTALTHSASIAQGRLVPEAWWTWSCQLCTQHRVVCSTGMRIHQCLGDAHQRCIERKDNMHSKLAGRPRGTKVGARGWPLEQNQTPSVHLQASSPTASAQRGRDTPAVPAHDYTSRFPGWLLPRNHS